MHLLAPPIPGIAGHSFWHLTIGLRQRPWVCVALAPFILSTRSTLTNPFNEGHPRMNVRLLTAVAVASATLAAGAASAAPLANASITTTAYVPGGQGTMTVTFTTATDLPAGSVFNLPYLTYFGSNLRGAARNNCSDISVAVNGAPRTLVYCQSSQGESFGQINGPVAPQSVVTYTTPIVFTGTPPSGTISARTSRPIDNAPIDSAAISIAPVAPVAPVPTLSEWAMIILGTVLAGGAALYVQRRKGFV